MAEDILGRIIHELPGRGGKQRAASVRVMTVRLPAELHDALRQEAIARNTSANRLAIAKLSIKAEQLDKIAALESNGKK